MAKDVPELYKIPLLGPLAEVMIGRLFSSLQNGELKLPPLAKLVPRKEAAEDANVAHQISIWMPNEKFSTEKYFIGFGLSFERIGTVPLSDQAPVSEALYQIRVRIFTDSRVKTGARDPLFKTFVKQFRREVALLLPDIRAINGGEFLWLSNFSRDGIFSPHQVKSWFDFSVVAPPRYLTSDVKGASDGGLRLGDTIFHGDGDGAHAGVLTLIVLKDDKQFGLTAGHVASLHGKAVEMTDMFSPQRGATDTSRRKKIGQFVGPPSLFGAFKDESPVELDAALVAPSIICEPNEFILGKRWKRVGKVGEVIPKDRDARPPVLIVRHGQNLQVAEVSAINFATPLLGEDDILLFYSNLIEIRPIKRNSDIVPKRLIDSVNSKGKITKDGDSGAIVLAVGRRAFSDQRVFEAVGLIVAGNSDPSDRGVAYALRMKDAQEQLDFTLPAR